MTDIVRFADFSPPDESPSFRVSPDTFLCLPEIPLDVLTELATLAQTQATGIERIQQMMTLFEGILEPDSYEIFARRMKRSTKEDPNPHPIGLRSISKALPWLMEVYGLRPTQESSSSADGSDSDDTSSMDGVSPEESTS